MLGERRREGGREGEREGRKEEERRKGKERERRGEETGYRERCWWKEEINGKKWQPEEITMPSTL